MDVILRFIDVNVIVRFFIGIFIFLMFLVLRKVITKLIFGLIEKLTKDIKDGFVSNLIGALEKPVANVVIIMGLYVSLNYMGISKVFLNQIIVSAIVLAVAAGLYSLDDYYAKTARLAFTNVNKKTSEVMIQLTVNVIKMLIIVLSFMIVCSEFFDINGFVAGLGITGFAIAFAAQESLASVVAGISIMIDSPFDVGDYIECNGNNGIVENINFRSTRIRTFEKDIRVIPNIILAKEAVINYSERGKRRVQFHLGVTYSTSREDLRTVSDKIESHLQENEMIDQEHLMIRFDNFGGSSLDILINYYINTNDWVLFMDEKEKINFEIMAILEECNVSCAFPSTSVYFENKLISEGIENA